MRKVISFIILSSFILVSNSVFSQEDSKNLALWNSVGVKYSPIKRLHIGLEQHLRLKENASVTDEYFTEVNLGYEIIKDFEISGGARFIRKNDNVGKKQGYENHFRYNIDVSFKHDIKRFTLSYRFRYQNKKEQDVAEDEENIAKENIRFKVGLGYNIKKWPLDPKLSFESYSNLEEVQQVRELGLNKFRITFGTSYNLKKFGKFGVFYRLQENIISNLSNEKTKIIGLKYSYSIK
jgi:hypothetical protein